MAEVFQNLKKFDDSLGEIEVDREFLSPLPLEVMRINTSNIRRFTVMNPFTLDVMHVDGQYLPCAERLCLSLLKDDETGRWIVHLNFGIANDRMRM